MNAILKMRRGCLFAVLAALVAMAAPAMAQLAVTNVRSSQRAGTKLVDIYYDLNSGPSWVSLTASSDAGATYAVPTSSVSGHVGAGVAPGTNRKITWNAGTDWNGQYSTAVKFRVTASDTAPVPAGMVIIPAGSFQMGDSFGDYGNNELPVHTVNVSAFYMEKNLVTKALWDEVRAWGLNNGYTDLDLGGGKAANHPVQTISWYATVKWCNARSQKEGLVPCYTVSGAVYKKNDSSGVICNMSASGYRLPTEAEWEKAARGGLSGKRFPWGDTISRSQANYYGNPSGLSYDLGPAGDNPTYANIPPYTTPYTSPVGSFPANGYGLYDMAGNVREWCWDWLWAYGSGAVSDPTGPASSTFNMRVYRGGGWGYYGDSCRVACRGKGIGYYPNTSNNTIGFRCARR